MWIDLSVEVLATVPQNIFEMELKNIPSVKFKIGRCDSLHHKYYITTRYPLDFVEIGKLIATLEREYAPAAVANSPKPKNDWLESVKISIEIPKEAVERLIKREKIRATFVKSNEIHHYFSVENDDLYDFGRIVGTLEAAKVISDITDLLKKD